MTNSQRQGLNSGRPYAGSEGLLTGSTMSTHARGRGPKPFRAVTHLEEGATPWLFTPEELPCTPSNPTQMLPVLSGHLDRGPTGPPTSLWHHAYQSGTSSHACVTPSGCSLKARTWSKHPDPQSRPSPPEVQHCICPRSRPPEASLSQDLPPAHIHGSLFLSLLPVQG